MNNYRSIIFINLNNLNRLLKIIEYVLKLFVKNEHEQVFFDLFIIFSPGNADDI